MEDRRDPMDKLVEAVYEYADDRIVEVQDLYRMKAKKLVKDMNQYREWGREEEDEMERENWLNRAFGIEEALMAFGFAVSYNVTTGESRLV